MLETLVQNTDEKNQRCAVCQCYLNFKKIKDDQINRTAYHVHRLEDTTQYSCQFSTKLMYRFKATLIIYESNKTYTGYIC